MAFFSDPIPLLKYSIFYYTSLYPFLYPFKDYAQSIGTVHMSSTKIHKFLSTHPEARQNIAREILKVQGGWR